MGQRGTSLQFFADILHFGRGGLPLGPPPPSTQATPRGGYDFRRAPALPAQRTPPFRTKGTWQDSRAMGLSSRTGGGASSRERAYHNRLCTLLPCFGAVAGASGRHRHPKGLALLQGPASGPPPAAAGAGVPEHVAGGHAGGGGRLHSTGLAGLVPAQKTARAKRGPPRVRTGGAGQSQPQSPLPLVVLAGGGAGVPSHAQANIGMADNQKEEDRPAPQPK